MKNPPNVRFLIAGAVSFMRASSAGRSIPPEAGPQAGSKVPPAVVQLLPKSVVLKSGS